MGRKESNHEVEQLIQKNSEISNSVLDLARTELKKNSNQTKKKQKKLAGVSIPILVTMLLFLLLLPISFVSDSVIPPEYGDSTTMENYKNLTKEEIISIESYNEKNGTSILSIHEAEVLNTYQLILKNNLHILEEHYSFQNVNCVLMVSQCELEFTDCNYILTNYPNLWMIFENEIFKGSILESRFYGNVKIEPFFYYLYIESENREIIDEILSNFK